MLAGHVLNWPMLREACLAFVAFSAAASAIYLFNDLVDIEDDRLHPVKKNRPLAAGEIGVVQALAVDIVLLAFSGGLSILLPYRFAVTLVGYLALTTSYSFWLKRKILIDVVLLALLYEIRVIAGGYATGGEMSSWLLGFCAFVFASLALMKRYTKLLVRLDANLPEPRLSQRGLAGYRGARFGYRRQCGHRARPVYRLATRRAALPSSALALGRVTAHAVSDLPRTARRASP